MLGRHVLLIPFHFPPIQGSTGASRSWEFAKWLPENDWRVTVLTVNQKAYPESTEDTGDLPNPDAVILRSFALDAKRHLSVFGHYLRVTALPDRWSSWIISGAITALRSIRKTRPDVLYTTYPIPSSHVIGFIVHKITGIPWVAEFRDPMVEENYPENSIERWMRVRLEKAIFARTSRIVTVTPSARNLYEERSGRGPGYVVEIPNGYSESIGSAGAASPPGDTSSTKSGMTLLHSGFLYEDVRNPGEFLRAVHILKSEGQLDLSDVKFVFRGSGNEQNYRRIVDELGIAGLVEFRESVSYADAYAEMSEADALILMQGKKCNRQIPAKLYEYCAKRKPILCLADPEGDTGKHFTELDLGPSASLEDPQSIKLYLQDFIEKLRHGECNVIQAAKLQAMSRRSRTATLAKLLDEVVEQASSGQ